MSRAEEIKAQLEGKFSVLADKITVSPSNRIYCQPVDRADFSNILDYLFTEMKYDFLHVVIGLHVGDNLEFAYVISNREDRLLLSLKQFAPISDPVIKTVTDKYPSALWHERELVDLFGAVVEGLPPGLTYPLPDGWPKGNYPLRKDWKVEYFDRETMTHNPPQPQAEAEAEKPSHESLSEE